MFNYKLITTPCKVMKNPSQLNEINKQNSLCYTLTTYKCHCISKERTKVLLISDKIKSIYHFIPNENYTGWKKSMGLTLNGLDFSEYE